MTSRSAEPAGLPDPRLHAYRNDLADIRLRNRVTAPRYAAGEPARIVIGCAPVRASPSHAAEVATFYHYGEPVLVFARDEGWAWCQSLDDRYVGYVGEAALGSPCETSHFVATMGSHVYAVPDLRSPAIDFLPRHSRAVVVETGLATRGTEYARLHSGACLPLACLSLRPPTSPDIAAAAALYLGCPYLWGGRSFVGIDCSGLVQSAFRDFGIIVPRDTDMQRDSIGETVPAGEVGDLRRGDLLYMPGHVLIYAERGEVVHADGGTMTVRRDDVAEWLRRRGLSLAGFTVRRSSEAAG